MSYPPENLAEFVIESRPDLKFKAWYDPNTDQLAIEGFNDAGLMVVGGGFRMAAAMTPEPAIGGDDDPEG